MNLHPSELRETHIESYLIREVKKLNGVAYKFTSPQKRSVPDRICIFKHSIIWFIECKRPGNQPTTAQWKEIYRLQKYGFNATYVDTYKKIDQLIHIINKQLRFLDEIFS